MKYNVEKWVQQLQHGYDGELCSECTPSVIHQAQKEARRLALEEAARIAERNIMVLGDLRKDIGRRIRYLITL